MRAQRNGSEAEGKGDRTSTAMVNENIKLAKLWDSLHSSYWFIPTLMALATIALAFMTLTLDRAGKIGPIEKLGWSYTGGPDGARSLLSAIAGSMIAVAATFRSQSLRSSLLLRISATAA